MQNPLGKIKLQNEIQTADVCERNNGTDTGTQEK
jgi:hypothetical protein